MAVLNIKNMVCDRCKMVVRSQIEQLGLTPGSIELGEIEIIGEPSPAQYVALSENLKKIGFEVIDNSTARIVEKIKNTIVELVHYTNNDIKTSHSDYIAEKLGKDYTYLSNLFSENEGSTIEKYIIRQKIERVKELLEYGELTLSEIAYRVGYSNVAYLSGLFKKVTGLTPSQFKESRQKSRKPLDKI
jgi:YesN/AraC family two-component response regulator